jgi:hypothetical protein
MIFPNFTLFHFSHIDYDKNPLEKTAFTLENSKPKKYHITEKLLPPLGTQKTQVC